MRERSCCEGWIGGYVRERGRKGAAGPVNRGEPYRGAREEGRPGVSGGALRWARRKSAGARRRSDGCKRREPCSQGAHQLGAAAGEELSSAGGGLPGGRRRVGRLGRSSSRGRSQPRPPDRSAPGAQQHRLSEQARAVFQSRASRSPATCPLASQLMSTTQAHRK